MEEIKIKVKCKQLDGSTEVADTTMNSSNQFTSENDITPIAEGKPVDITTKSLKIGYDDFAQAFYSDDNIFKFRGDISYISGEPGRQGLLNLMCQSIDDYTYALAHYSDEIDIIYINLYGFLKIRIGINASESDPLIEFNHIIIDKSTLEVTLLNTHEEDISNGELPQGCIWFNTLTDMFDLQ